jgi:hypothetical protein
MPIANTYLPGTLVIPGVLLITNITQSMLMIVSIVDSPVNSYRTQQLVRLDIPAPYGMQQANGLTGEIVRIVGTDFYLAIDSTYFDAFSVPADGPLVTKPASLSPAGSRNLQYDNFSNNVPFQNLNNIGN